MLHTDDIDEDTKRICCGCVGETFLSEEIERTGAEAACSYCTDTAPCWNIEALADRIETAFDHHYTCATSSSVCPRSQQAASTNYFLTAGVLTRRTEQHAIVKTGSPDAY